MTVNDNFIVATGTTVALPTGKLTVGGSFLNSGYVMHNNAEVEFVSNTSEIIQLQGTNFLNYLYDVTFDGSGDWTFTDVNATTSGFIHIDDWSVTFPTGVLMIGDTLRVLSGGSFAHADGTVHFTSGASETVRTAGSAFYDVVFGDGALGWYDENWSRRIEVVVDEAIPQETLTNYPLFIDLSGLGVTFWGNVASDGRDIRVTSADGETELPHELVSIDTGTQSGELHFLAPVISDVSSTTYYIYIGNNSAVAYDPTDTYGRNAVWRNYEAVYHFHEDPTSGATDVSGHGKDLALSVGTPGTTTGPLGQALDTTGSNVRLEDSDWTWTAGEDLTSSGLFFQAALDTGALWQFGVASGGSEETYLHYLPWYDSSDRGYYRFGETSGSDFRYTLDTGVWHHFTTIGRAAIGGRNELYENNILRDTVVQTADGENPTNTGLRIAAYQTTVYMDIMIDELRFASSTPSEAWIDYEYNNLRKLQTLYSVAGEQFQNSITSFTLNEANTTVDNDLTLAGARLVAPSNTFYIGGSALNTTGVYDPNSATTTFNSTDTGESFAFGDVSFYNLAFDGISGGWTVSTTTVENNLTLANGASYVQATNTTMTVGGIFSNQFASAATNWTNSTLVLTGGDYTVTGRLDAGDDYAILEVSNDSDIIIWNSTISTSSVADTSSIYMPDFGGTPGQLNIYGEYDRTTGTEYWSYATDFDGTDLTGGGERAVNVYLEGGASVNLATSTTLEMIGAAAASTTVQSLFGIYSIELIAATLEANYFSLLDSGPLGLEVRNGSTLNTFTNGEFFVAPGRTALTVDATTINAQPSSNFSAVHFATSTAGTIYKNEWNEQVLLSIHASSVDETLENFPVYVDLSVLGNDFWSGVRADGADIRMTTDTGREIAIDMVEINTAARTGELHFLAPELSPVSDTTFYIHYNNPGAAPYAIDDIYGAGAVWADYEAVYHFEEDPASGITDKTGNGYDLAVTVGVAATTSGQIGTALDTTASNVMLTDADWTWQPGDDLVSSGLYYQDALDNGALFEWGDCAGDDCIAFMPWYDNGGAGDRGYFRFGETSGNDYSITPRNNTIWHHFTGIGRAEQGELVEFYEDNTQHDTYAQSANGENPSKTGFKIGRYQGGTYMDIQVDELRLTTTIPSNSWRKAEYFNLTSGGNFYATSTGPTEVYNITTDGIPTTFWLFANGSGNIYGENFDNDDGDPGSIQWDDSDYNITIAGTVYQDDGVTPETAPVCNGSTEVVTIVLDGVDTFRAPCDPVDGTYEVSGIVYSGEPKIVAYVDSNAPTGQVNVGLAGQTTGSGAIAGNTITLDRPTIEDDTVLIAVIGKDDDNGPVAPPAGWVEIDSLATAGGDSIFSGAWYRVVSTAAIEPLTYDFTSTDNGESYSWWLGAVVNANTAAPIDVAGTWVNYQNEVSVPARSVTTVTNGALAVATWWVADDDDVTLPATDWSTVVQDLTGADTNALSVQVKSIDTAGATGDVFANNIEIGNETQSLQFAIQPAATIAATSSIVAATVSQTPIGAGGSAYKTITLRDQRTDATTTAAASSIYVNAPNMEDGDVLVAILGKEDDLGITAPAGWITAADRAELTGSQMYSGIWYKTISDAASEPAVYEFINDDTSTEEIAYWVGAFENVDDVNVFDVSPSWSNLQNTSAPTAPSVTTVTPGAYVLAAWTIMFDNTTTMPGGSWATLAEDIGDGSRTLNVAGRRFSSAGATGGVTVTDASTDDVNVGQFALRPAAASVAEGIDNFDLYQNRVIVRHEDIIPLSIADMTTFDSTDDSDVPFTASTSTSPDSLTVLTGNGLYVYAGMDFAPNGTVTLAGGSHTSVDGSLGLGAGATYISTGTNAITIGGSLTAESGATFSGAESLLTFTATNTGAKISSAASSTFSLYDLAFTGSGSWSILTPLLVDQDVLASAGTIGGVANVRLTNGSFYGNGNVAMTGGTVQVDRDNVLGGTTPWTFYNLTLGSGAIAGVTYPAASATTTVINQLRISTAHFLGAYGSIWDLAGSGSVFLESGTFLEGTSTVRYSGTTPTITRTAYNDLVIDTDAGGNASVTATAPGTGLQVLGDLTVGAIGTSTLNVNTNDPLLAVGGDVTIGTLGTLLASNSNTINVFGGWNNDGVFTANGGTVEFLAAGGTHTIAAGSSTFANLTIIGTADYVMTEHATATNDMELGANDFVLQSGQTLAVGGAFTNGMSDIETTWSGTTLRLYGSQAYTVNPKATGDTYSTIEVSSSTHPRFWNSTTTVITTEAGSSLYSMDHADVPGDLYIFGDFVNVGYDDHWSYAEDFDGTTLGVPRVANVYVEDGGSVLYGGGSLTILGSTSASTTIAAIGSGPYDFTIGGTTTIDFDSFIVREQASAGMVLTGTPDVTDITGADFLVTTPGGSGMTIGGSVINVNQAQNFSGNRFATSSPITGVNITATGTAVSSWRFVNVGGNLDGEDYDVDPGGDPGYIVWEDSAAIIDISGVVYQEDRTTLSRNALGGVCDSVTNNIRLVVGTAGATTQFATSCDWVTGEYTFTGIGFGPSDTLMVYIDGETDYAANVTKDPISLISTMDLYHNHVIVRHESTGPMTIEAMAVYDSSDDADIPFTAVTAATNTLSLPADTQLLVWTDKTFSPQGNITLSGGGSGSSYDGTLELLTDAVFDASAAEVHSIGGSLISAAGATFDADSATTTFTSTFGGETLDTNDSGFYNLAFTGSGDWTLLDTEGDINNNLTITGGTLTLPAATTTVSGSFINTSGSFVASNGVLIFDATDAGNIVQFAGSDPHTVTFTGSGSWTMSDTEATTTDSFTVAAGAVTLPTGTLVVQEDFVVDGTIAHAGGTVRLTSASTGSEITLGGNDLSSLVIDAATGDYTLTDASATLLGDLTVLAGDFVSGTGTLTVGGSFDVSGGVFTHSTGTVLLNSASGGEFIDPGLNHFYNLVIAGTGGWTLAGNATTSNNFSLSNANTFTVTSGSTVYVGGVFTNNVGGGATTWTNTTLVLDGRNEYETNSKSTSVELYETVVLGENTDISMWRASAATTTVPSSSSLYSQDHAGSDGSLFIYGDYHIATTTEYWSATTDFDGAVIGSRAVSVQIASSSTITVDGGVLNIIGDSSATTTIANQGAGTFTFLATDGILNASYFDVTDVTSAGLQLLGDISISSLSNGYFSQNDDNQTLITLASTTLDANAGLTITNTGFDANGFSGGVNVALDATTTNSWTFAGEVGDLWGEAYDVDGTDDCSSIRWDDSQCLLTEQKNYRWRNDDGDEGAAPGTWYDGDWSSRQRIRVINDDATAYASTAVKVVVPYDTDMQSSFADLRVTDSDGTTLVPHWTERVQAGAQAVLWFQAPSLPADTVSEFYLYYGNGAAVSTSDGDAVFELIEDFEDNNLAAYGGDTGLFTIDSSFAYGGSLGLDATGFESSRATDGIARDDITVSRGQRIRYMQYIDTGAGANDEVCTLFATQDPVTDNDNYAICVEQPGIDRISIVRDVSDTEFSGTILASSSVSISSGWYEFIIDWQSNGTIGVTMYDSTGTTVATASAVDTTYSTGGIGFTFWFQNGGWDSYVAWPRTRTQPTVHLGAKQADGGASWASAQNSPGSGFAFGETARLRVGIENTGLDIENQNFQLEFAPKLTAPTCAAVPVVNYSEVPVLASCGASAICMAASANVSNGDPTSDHLVTDAGDFVAGEIIANTSNETANFDLNQNRYSEFEYAVQLTANAINDSYCFRVTNDGATLDSYSNLPELNLEFDPALDTIVLNDGLDIVLTAGQTTTVIASTTVTDLNGVVDLDTATTTFYTTSATASCTPDDNNCYIATSTCSFSNCTGTSCSLQCTADLQYHADPTDFDGGEEWFAFMEVRDSGGASDFGTSIGVELLTLRAMDVQNSIGYGVVDINENTGSFNPSVNLLNLGNEAIDVQISGTDMTDGVTSVIPAGQQLFATSSFTYLSCTTCSALTVTPATVEVDLAKPLTDDPAVSDTIYWGIEVPFGTASNPHTGVNYFTAIAD